MKLESMTGRNITKKKLLERIAEYPDNAILHMIPTGKGRKFEGVRLIIGLPSINIDDGETIFEKDWS